MVFERAVTQNMYSRTSGRPQRSGGSFSGRPKPSFRGSRGPVRRNGNGRRKDTINENLFVSKAVPVEETVYESTHAFNDFKIGDTLKQNIIAKGYLTPSPIQDQAIPAGLEGKDIIGIAGTGTGKTAAFLIPLIEKLTKSKNPHHEKVMVMAPTRELAQQIEKEFGTFATRLRLYSVICVGGAPISRQMREIERGVHVVIGTPGRIKDLIARKKIVPSDFTSVVLDEADRMLDMGFIDDMRFILRMMPKERQTLFFSATFSPEIKALTSEFLQSPVTISVKTRQTAENVEQDVIRVKHKGEKIDRLHDILNKPECAKVLVFCEMKRSVDQLQTELASRGFKALGLHGDMRNRERERAVRALAQGEAQVVIATDVAARGIDIADITHVINYDTPSTYDTYIHRIGRTGRGSSRGTALTFVH
jgi:ATP-dependent RNA helicase RhlE